MCCSYNFLHYVSRRKAIFTSLGSPKRFSKIQIMKTLVKRKFSFFLLNNRGLFNKKNENFLPKWSDLENVCRLCISKCITKHHLREMSQNCIHIQHHTFKGWWKGRPQFFDIFFLLEVLKKYRPEKCPNITISASRIIWECLLEIINIQIPTSILP